MRKKSARSSDSVLSVVSDGLKLGHPGLGEKRLVTRCKKHTLLSSLWRACCYPAISAQHFIAPVAVAKPAVLLGNGYFKLLSSVVKGRRNCYFHPVIAEAYVRFLHPRYQPFKKTFPRRSNAVDSNAWTFSFSEKWTANSELIYTHFSLRTSEQWLVR
jgi:hypothetical protein